MTELSTACKHCGVDFKVSSTNHAAINRCTGMPICPTCNKGGGLYQVVCDICRVWTFKAHTRKVNVDQPLSRTDDQMTTPICLDCYITGKLPIPQWPECATCAQSPNLANPAWTCTVCRRWDISEAQHREREGRERQYRVALAVENHDQVLMSLMQAQEIVQEE